MRPSIVDEYREKTAQFNALKKDIDKLKPEIKRIIDETGGFDDLYYQTRGKAKYHEDLIYDWIAKTYPDFLEDITKKTVDLEKFGEYVKLKKIDGSKIPEEAAYIEYSTAIMTKPKKKEEEDE